MSDRPQLTFSQSTNERTHVLEFRVLLNGQPIMANTASRALALTVFNKTYQDFKRRSMAVVLLAWDGDKGVECAFNVEQLRDAQA